MKTSRQKTYYEDKQNDLSKFIDYKNIKDWTNSKNKSCVLHGDFGVGKTTLVDTIIESEKIKNVHWFKNADDYKSSYKIKVSTVLPNSKLSWLVYFVHNIEKYFNIFMSITLTIFIALLSVFLSSVISDGKEWTIILLSLTSFAVFPIYLFAKLLVYLFKNNSLVIFDNIDRIDINTIKKILTVIETNKSNKYILIFDKNNLQQRYYEEYGENGYSIFGELEKYFDCFIDLNTTIYDVAELYVDELPTDEFDFKKHFLSITQQLKLKNIRAIRKCYDEVYENISFIEKVKLDIDEFITVKYLEILNPSLAEYFMNNRVYLENTGNIVNTIQIGIDKIDSIVKDVDEQQTISMLVKFEKNVNYWNAFDRLTETKKSKFSDIRVNDYSEKRGYHIDGWKVLYFKSDRLKEISKIANHINQKNVSAIINEITNKYTKHSSMEVFGSLIDDTNFKLVTQMIDEHIDDPEKFEAIKHSLIYIKWESQIAIANRLIDINVTTSEYILLLKILAVIASGCGITSGDIEYSRNSIIKLLNKTSSKTLSNADEDNFDNWFVKKHKLLVELSSHDLKLANVDITKFNKLFVFDWIFSDYIKYNIEKNDWGVSDIKSVIGSNAEVSGYFVENVVQMMFMIEGVDIKIWKKYIIDIFGADRNVVTHKLMSTEFVNQTLEQYLKMYRDGN